MTLNSVTYIIFLPIVYAVFAVVPLRMRWVPLLLFSIYFYMTIDTFMVLFLFSTILITFLIALIIGRTNGPVRLFLLWLGIIANIMLLIFSRYPHLLSSILPVKALLLSVGVSYYVFQAISYLVDVHLEIVEPERHLGYFALYLS